jgi:spore germination protein GerM
MRKRPALVAVAVALAIVAAACGVPKDGHPREIDAANVPFDLLAPTTSSSTTTPGGAVTSQVTIYLADTNNHLVARQRKVEVPSSVTKALTALFAGPQPDESDLHSAITSNTKLLRLRGPIDGLVTIDLSRAFLDVTGRQQILALAEVVYTATAYPGVDRVLFQFEGTSREVPNGDGTLTSTPLTRLSYRGLVAG